MTNNHRVTFEKPPLIRLTKSHTVVDMHFHSRHSDGLNRVSRIADRARKLGIGIAVTDHNAIEGAVRLDKFSDFLTIPGIEVTSVEGTHILLYFYDMGELVAFYEKDLRPFLGKDVMMSTALPMENIISLAAKYKTLKVFPHPYCAAYTGVCNMNFTPERQARLFELVDGIEAINAGNLKKWNLRSALLGFNLKKMMTAGSDGHNLFQMGKAVTFTKPASNRTAFLDALKQGACKVMGKEVNVLGKVTSNGSKIRTSLKNYPHLIEKNARYSYAYVNHKSKAVKDSMQRRLIDWSKS